MNNSITKLKDFELDEISGGITAKQKKTLASAIKSACALISGFAAIGLQHLVMRKTHLISKVSEGCTKLFGEKGSDDLGTYYDPTLFSKLCILFLTRCNFYSAFSSGMYRRIKIRRMDL